MTTNIGRRRRIAPLLLVGLMLPGAEVVAAEPQTLKARVTGLFAPDREGDLRQLLEEWPEVTLVSVDFAHAETVLRLDAGKLFPGVKPDQVLARLDEKVRGASHGTFGLKPPSTVPRDKLKRVEIPVVGLDCKACCLAAYESVARIDGVEQATASFKDGLITALINPEKTTRATLEEALKMRRVQLKSP